MVTEFESEFTEPGVEYVQAPLRAFLVTCVEGRLVTVFAHRHENNNVAGHLNFITDHPEERALISHGFHSAIWREIEEVFDPKVLALAAMHARGIH